MKILMMSIGTRGDCEPFLAVGELLREHGNQVICAFPEQYRRLANQCAFPFYPLGSELIALTDSTAGQQAFSGKGFERLKGLITITGKSLPIQKENIIRQKQIVDEVLPDCIIYHPKAAYPLLWTLETGQKSIILMPTLCILHEVPGIPHVGLEKFPVPLSYQLGAFSYVQNCMFAIKQLYRGKYTSAHIRKTLLSAPALYTVSPSIVKRPDLWNSNILMAGFRERNQSRRFVPGRKLLYFLDRHQKIILITFGSITNPYPRKYADQFIRVLEQLKIPAIINIAGGGLRPPGRLYNKELILFVDSAPYNWLMPKMYAVVHHGGAGTTQSALRAGCASLAIPHFGDQTMWSRLLYRTGAGPEGIPITRLSPDTILKKLSDLYINPAYKTAAERIAASMRSEQNAETLYHFIMEGKN